MTASKEWRGIKLYTIGHSTRTQDELVAMLRVFDISVLADIRTVPRSRHNPQFNGDALRSTLRSRHLRYVQIPELGGLRRTRKDSPNTAWRNASFRGFADYMTARGVHVEHITSAKHSAPHRMTAFAVVKNTRVTYPGEDSAGAPFATRSPFHLEATVRVLQRRPTNLVDIWEQERYLRVLAAADGLALVEVTNRGTIDAPDVRFTIVHGNVSTATRAALEKTVRKMLGLDVDPKPLQVLAESERRLRPTALALQGMRPPRFSELFEAFGNVVPFQQVSLDAGVAIVGRLVETFGKALEHDGCGLSLRKAETLRQIASAMESGEMTEKKLARMSSKEAVRFLAESKGIGPWSASLVLLRGMGRLDVFPPGDVGVARGLSRLMRLETGPSLDRVVQRFGDHRGYLYFCSLGGSLLAKNLIHAAHPPG